jgi:hypothetical protein
MIKERGQGDSSKRKPSWIMLSQWYARPIRAVGAWLMLWVVIASANALECLKSLGFRGLERLDNRNHPRLADF